MDFTSIANPFLFLLFAAATAAIWVAGIRLTKAIDVITIHFDLGEAFGGMVFLAIVTNLPEIAITFMAAKHHAYDLAVSNLLGGVAIQTVVLVLIDVFGVGRSAPLTHKGHSSILVLEGVALILILTLVLMAKEFPSSFIFFRTTPFEWLILFIWLGSIFVVAKRTRRASDEKKQAQKVEEMRHPKAPMQGGPSLAIWTLIIGAMVTLFAGYVLEVAGETMISRFDMSGALFGGTLLALCTALPEISTGIASAKLRNYNMAVSDIFGGNAFLPVLFLFASLIGGDAIIPNLNPTDAYLTALGIFLTGIYIIGMVLHSKKQILRMGIDSFIVLIVYLLGLLGLTFLS